MSDMSEQNKEMEMIITGMLERIAATANFVSSLGSIEQYILKIKDIKLSLIAEDMFYGNSGLGESLKRLEKEFYPTEGSDLHSLRKGPGVELVKKYVHDLKVFRDTTAETLNEQLKSFVEYTNNGVRDSQEKIHIPAIRELNDFLKEKQVEFAKFHSATLPNEFPKVNIVSEYTNEARAFRGIKKLFDKYLSYEGDSELLGSGTFDSAMLSEFKDNCRSQNSSLRNSSYLIKWMEVQQNQITIEKAAGYDSELDLKTRHDKIENIISFQYKHITENIFARFGNKINDLIPLAAADAKTTISEVANGDKDEEMRAVDYILTNAINPTQKSVKEISKMLRGGVDRSGKK